VNVVAFVGESGSGKTTAIAGLIRHFTANGQTVAVIKHTHHAINDDNRGDTAEFRRCGADPVILAGDGEAVVFRGTETRRVRFQRAQDLLAQLNTETVFIEGFKSVHDWPRIELDSVERRSTTELLAILDRIWRP
jgi:molybdopterin-guanine dinucleotide biosynthesis adapter protein